MQTNADAQRDLDALTALNLDFFASVQEGDVKRFEEILADDFMSSQPDGTLLDKAKFLELTAQPVTISGLVAEDVRIRVLGDFAIIHGRFDSRSADGKPRRGRYTDNWARRDGTWAAVSAHFHLDQDG
ncbi:nuclear transport factor 2 family protein [Tautonia plasticadhaerens]|uniref:SnoaL-like domain protein n=1 Tax=Tautonia plasticadhaerens TaxID=2527974 RepID=A0A518H649_9BACT|nr:nuclear transport factor 2 family protein [Tautonia plasticadhaerens]QDV36317.1 SnoaL-like domain protein [Tautonia plasticadhaerens]